MEIHSSELTHHFCLPLVKLNCVSFICAFTFFWKPNKQSSIQLSIVRIHYYVRCVVGSILQKWNYVSLLLCVCEIMVKLTVTKQFIILFPQRSKSFANSTMCVWHNCVIRTQTFWAVVIYALATHWYTVWLESNSMRIPLQQIKSPYSVQRHFPSFWCWFL